jgi:hypothetical protein
MLWSNQSFNALIQKTMLRGCCEATNPSMHWRPCSEDVA